ncbi:MAG: NAD(P)/FAD-dependent oxidoreductase [Candidatus Thermoplasmatota archaeon]|nr:NAD(P)/FAD-dependent oxidoreductase [Candidatus Thermoplasmatota archaeon]
MAHDVLIVGAGPAGMFASYEISEKDKGILVVDKGKDIDDRTDKEIMCGIGGAGTYSDGTVNLRPDIGGNLREYTKNENNAWELVEYIQEILSEHGMPEPKKENQEREEELKRRAASIGAKFFPILQSHIGSDKAPAVIKSFKKELEERGVEFKVETEVEDLLIEDGKCVGVVTSEGEKIEAEKTVLAPGRVGIDWVQKLTEEYPLDSDFAPIDIGVRVEVPSIIMDPVIEVNRDPKFHLYTKSYDDFVRTFCTNHKGFVVKETYDGFIGVNGHSMKELETDKTNFAFLVRTDLTEPIEDTTRYGRAIAQLASTIGGGKPIVQRLGDLREGRRSTESRIKRNPTQPTLDDYTPGDISMALPERAVVDIKEGLEMLDEIIPGVDSGTTLLYAPEIKFYANHLKVDEGLQTSISDLYAAGDGAGLSHDIVNAAATGIIAGRSIRDDL